MISGSTSNRGLDLPVFHARRGGSCLLCGSRVNAGNLTGYDPQRRRLVCLTCTLPKGISPEGAAASKFRFPDDGVFVIVDTETTGLSPKDSRIVEIAAVTVDGKGNVLDYWDTLVNPRGPVGETSIHGIRPSMVTHAPFFEDIAGDFLQRVRDKILVAHNLPFDLRFIRAELGRLSADVPAVPNFCTLQLSRRLIPEQGKHKLEYLNNSLGLRVEAQTHGAGDDAVLTGKLLAHLRQVAITKGVVYDIPLIKSSRSSTIPATGKRLPRA